MSKAIINFLNTDTTVSRSEPYNLQFKITKPTMDNDITKKIDMIDEGNLNTNKVYSANIKKSEWTSITSIEQESIDTNEYINIIGKTQVSYRYKVEIVETSVILKSFTDYIVTDTVDTSINISKEMLATWNPYNIKITIEQSDGITVENTLQIHVYDTEPILNIVNIENNILSFQIGDLESDDVKYRIKLNGCQIYPPNTTDMTILQPSPVSGNILLPKDKIKPKESNIVMIEAEDSWGKFISFTPTTFIGEYQGLMFVDELDNVYTTDMGIIKKMIDFGLIQAGQESVIKTVYLKNLTGYSIKDLIIKLDTSVSVGEDTGKDIETTSIPSKTAIWLAKDTNSFTEGNDTIIFNQTIMSGEKISFVLKVTTDIFSTGVGQFGLYAVATPN